MYFGLEDKRDNTILGTPKQELYPLAEKLRKSLEESIEIQKNEQDLNRGTEMNNGDRIRSMTNEGLARFMFRWQVNLIDEVLKNGFVNTLNFLEMQEWMESESKPHDIFEKWEGGADDGKEKAN